MKKILKGKKILITAGPVWVKIDPVRILTNIAGGSLGYNLAKIASAMGADVTLILGPGRVRPTGKEKFTIKPFKFFNELHDLLKEEISSKTYDAVYHSCAVPDYTLKKEMKGKIKSGAKELTLTFKPTIKLIDQFRKWDKDIFICKFKFEANKTVDELCDIAYDSMKFSKANLIMANRREDVTDTTHIGYVITPEAEVTECRSKEAIAVNLLKAIA